MGKKSLPQRLKRLEASDLLPMKDSNGDFLVVTKQETRAIIEEFIRNEIINVGDDYIENSRMKFKQLVDSKIPLFEKMVNDRISLFEKSVDAFISHKFDLLAEKICETLISRQFNEEVERVAERKLKEKRFKGKF